MEIHRIYGKGNEYIDVDENTAWILANISIIIYTGEGVARNKAGDAKTVFRYRRATNAEYLSNPLPEDM